MSDSEWNERPDAVMLLSNGFSNDPRVRKEAASLASSGRSLVVLAWDRAADLPPESREYGCRVIRFARRSSAGSGLKQLASFLRFWVWSARRAIYLRPRMLHCHDLDMYVPALIAAKVLRVPLLYDAHEVYAEMQVGRMPSPFVWLLRKIDLWAARRADAVVTVGESTREYYGAVRDEVTVVGNWSDPVESDAATAADVRGHLGIPADAFVLGHLGALANAKNFEPLLAAVERDSRLYAIIAGTGEQEARISAFAERQPRLKYVGYTRTPEHYYPALDALYYLFSDAYDYARFSSSNAIGIAFAYCRPIVTDRKGDTGRIAASVAGDLLLEEPTAEEVLRVVNVLRMPERQERMCRLLREQSDATYSWRAAARELERVYERILRPSQPSRS